MSKAANIGCFIGIIFLIFVIIGITKIDSSEKMIGYFNEMLM